MASFEKRGKTWRYVISYIDNEGKKRKKSKGGFKTKKDAQIASYEVESKKKDFKNHDWLFSDYFLEWAETFKKNVVEERTYTSKYLHVHKTIEKLFKNKLLSEITNIEYQKKLNEYADTHSVYSVKLLNSRIRSCLKQAIFDEIISKDFTFNATIGGIKSKKSNFLQLEEYEKLFERVKTPKNKSELIILIMLTSGLRYSEVLGLTSECVKNGCIIVKQSFDTFTYNRLKTTKNEQSERSVSVPEFVTDKIKEFRKIENEFDIFFFGDDKKAYRIESMNKSLKKICKELGIKEITTHGLRHTHASILILNGVSLLSVSKRLGHKDTTITQQTYIHLLEKMEHEDNQKILKIFSNSP